MQIEICGVRGGIASSGRHTAFFGGNTPCVRVDAADGTTILLDAGTGIRTACSRSGEATTPQPIHILLSHFHWDHVQGLPFFAPLWSEGSRVHIYAARAAEDTERAVREQFAQPYFPVPMDAARAEISFHDVREIRNIGGVTVKAFEQHHPQGSTGYRLEEAGAAFVYATDSEPGNPVMDAALDANAAGASLLVLDAQYTPEEAALRRGWGHGHWRRACEVAERCGVGRLLLFHHDPDRDDDALRAIEASAQTMFGKTEAAREGARFHL